jgi:hypothetical protein
MLKTDVQCDLLWLMMMAQELGPRNYEQNREEGWVDKHPDGSRRKYMIGLCVKVVNRLFPVMIRWTLPADTFPRFPKIKTDRIITRNH